MIELFPMKNCQLQITSVFASQSGIRQQSILSVSPRNDGILSCANIVEHPFQHLTLQNFSLNDVGAVRETRIKCLGFVCCDQCLINNLFMRRIFLFVGWQLNVPLSAASWGI